MTTFRRCLVTLLTILSGTIGAEVFAQSFPTSPVIAPNTDSTATTREVIRRDDVRRNRLDSIPRRDGTDYLDGVIPDGRFEVISFANDFDTIGQNTSFRIYIIRLLNFLLSFLGIIAVAMVIYGGYLYVVSIGDDGNSEKGKKIITYAAIGIIIILASFAFVNTIIRHAGRGTDDRDTTHSLDGDRTELSSGTGVQGGLNQIETGTGGIGFSGGPTTIEGGTGSLGVLTDISRGTGSVGVITGITRGTGSDGGINPGGGSGVTSGLIRVEGSNVVDYGKGVSVPLETAKQGIDIILNFEGRAQVDLGDGTSAEVDTTSGSNRITNKVYGEKGFYRVRANLVDADNNRGTAFKDIVVGGGISPQITVPREAIAGDPVTLSAAGSRSSVGTITKYEWSCQGAGGCFSNTEGEEANVTFSQQGLYEVTLRLENSVGGSDTISESIQIKANEPLAAFTFESAGDPFRPASFTFDASQSLNIMGDTTDLYFIWDFAGDRLETVEKEITYEFDDIGSHTVSLIVTQRQGTRRLLSPTVTQSVSVDTVIGLEVLVGGHDVLIDPTSGVNTFTPQVLRGKQILFSANSAQATEFEWTFPTSGISDNIRKLGDQVSFTFEDLRTNRVQLTAIDKIRDERRDVSIDLLVREQGQPTAILEVSVDGQRVYGTSARIHRGQNLTFNSLSVDDTGQSGNIRETYLVNSRVVRRSEINRYLRTIGKYEIVLVASSRDDANKRDQDQFSVQVVNAPPEVTGLSYSLDQSLGSQRVRLEAQANDPDGEIAEYRFRVRNDDTGQIQIGQVSKRSFALLNLNQFPGVQRYRFEVTVVDDDQGSSEYLADGFLEVDNEIENTPPTAAIYLTPSNAGTPNVIFSFSGQGIDAEGDALTYLWHFPDGQRFGRQHSYRFVEPGTYTVRLEVSDGLETASEEVTVNIITSEEARSTNPEDNTPPTVSITQVLPDTTVEVNSPVYFYALGQDDDRDALTYQWDLGDGAKSNVPNTAHFYTQEGSYSIRLTASDGLAEGTDETTLTVVPAGTLESLTPEELEALRSKYEEDPRNPLSEGDISLLANDISQGDGDRDGAETGLQGGTLEGSLDLAALQNKGLLGEQKIDIASLRNSSVIGDQGDVDLETLRNKNLITDQGEIDLEAMRNRGFIRKDGTIDVDALKNPLYLGEGIYEQGPLPGVHENAYVYTDLKNKLEGRKTKVCEIAETGSTSQERDEAQELCLNLELQEQALLQSQSTLDLLKLEALLEEDPDRKAQIEKKIQAIEAQESSGNFDLATISGTQNSKFFLYGVAPQDYPRALSFTWDLGDGRTTYGQNISTRYQAPGTYLVILTVSDGVLEVSDLMRVQVFEKGIYFGQ